MEVYTSVARNFARNLTAKESQSKEVSEQRSFTATEVSQQRSLTAKKSRTKASFSQVEVAFVFQFLKEISHEAPFFFGQVQLAVSEGSLARNASLRDRGCTKPYVLQYKTCL